MRPMRAALLAALARAQYMEGTDLLAQTAAAGEEVLSDWLDTNEAIVGATEAVIDIDVYDYDFPEDFTIQLILDPCRGKDYDCCNGVYGAGEYQVDPDTWEILSPYEAVMDNAVTVDDVGDIMDADVVRKSDDQVIYDESCVGFGDPREDCVGLFFANIPNEELPVCWDHNLTVAAGGDCRDPWSGDASANCLELAYSQTASVVSCGGDWADSDHCGTFLEVHLPGGSFYEDEEFVISETKLTGEMFISGFQTTTIPSSYGGDAAKTICNYKEALDPDTPGNYEIWWVLRTRYNFIVQEKKRFRVVEPECEFDLVNDQYFPYAYVNATAGSNSTSSGSGSGSGG